MSLRVEFVTKENVLVVRFEGELDHHETSKLRESWRGQLQQNDVDHVVVNLEKLNFMDSSGLGVMLGRYKEVQASGNEMIICSISPEVRRLFDLSGMFKIMRLVDSESYALELLGVASCEMR
ncbi:anti-sigma F factor antagonist [Halobacillus halophilus]|uniref:Anti-sigma F factor antagonist n=1 Tax=Halobacillus halophilus (strain ATCC 35676 / DSM 2266 / JCM 20832 / KCTC 3685 / LMG 17431 / NBRC 102448 / NCIMB 2269) TaxID=866895 RepID=I0JNH7_HALH3|nr:anti-sigma F factor antagonist [Halobacillus halophilus]ASF39756.1 anti-sigma F factor antagonist [Halobacillus halophilus]CCG45697.1 anti-sigma F factor antagonist [Halobacillus halophilus DSM 2266]